MKIGKMDPNPSEIYENRTKSSEIDADGPKSIRNSRKSTQIHPKSMKMEQNPFEIHERRPKSIRNPSKLIKIHPKSMKMNQNPSEIPEHRTKFF